MGILKLYKDDGEYVEELGEEKTFALIELEKELLASRNSMIIGSKFDSDLNANICRLAFYGVLHDNN